MRLGPTVQRREGMELAPRQDPVAGQRGPVIDRPRRQIDPDVPLPPGPNTPHAFREPRGRLPRRVAVRVRLLLRAKVEEIDVDPLDGLLPLEILPDQAVDGGVRDREERGAEGGGGLGDLGAEGVGEGGGEGGRGMGDVEVEGVAEGEAVGGAAAAGGGEGGDDVEVAGGEGGGEEGGEEGGGVGREGEADKADVDGDGEGEGGEGVDEAAQVPGLLAAAAAAGVGLDREGGLEGRREGEEGVVGGLRVAAVLVAQEGVEADDRGGGGRGGGAGDREEQEEP